MSKKDIAIFVISIPFLGYLYWLLADALSGWLPVLQLMGVMMIMFVILGTVMLLFWAFIYFLTIFRSKIYVKKLQKAGYLVKINRNEVWDFAIIGLITIIYTPVTIYATYRLTIIDNWDPFLVLIFGLMWMICLVGLYSTVTIWWRSFRPLHKHYKALKAGQSVDLPVLIE